MCRFFNLQVRIKNINMVYLGHHSSFVLPEYGCSGGFEEKNDCYCYCYCKESFFSHRPNAISCLTLTKLFGNFLSILFHTQGYQDDDISLSLSLSFS